MGAPRTGLQRRRGTFAEQLQSQVTELSLLLRDAAEDDELMDVLEVSLGSIASTASALELTVVANAATRAQSACRKEGAAKAVDDLATLCKRLQGHRSLFRPVLLLADEEDLERLRARVGHAPVPIRLCASVDSVLRETGPEPPSAVIVPMETFSSVLTELRWQEGLAKTPVFVYDKRARSEVQDLHERTRAAREGAAGYLDPDLSVPDIVAAVWESLYDDEGMPHRVLVSMFDHKAVELVRQALRSPEIVLRHQPAPTRLLPDIASFQPDMIILDLDPDSTAGPDLCRVLRQHELWRDTLITFLAPNAGLVRFGMRAGADDVLVRGLRRDEFRGRIMGQLTRRRRRLRSEQKDPLTGTMNPGPLLQRATQEIDRAQRSGSPLAVGLIDVDGLRLINERNGMGAGDTVLRLAAKAFKTTLRDTDVIGRVGPDELVVLLWNCNAAQAQGRIEDALQLFHHLCRGNPKLSDVRLSAGVADTTNGKGKTLSRAESAMLEARYRGAGQVGSAV
jgi:diguanylate cyclase (GGDEF)-like protein